MSEEIGLIFIGTATAKLNAALALLIRPEPFNSVMMFAMMFLMVFVMVFIMVMVAWLMVSMMKEVVTARSEKNERYKGNYKNCKTSHYCLPFH